jgi:hypothetical protein
MRSRIALSLPFVVSLSLMAACPAADPSVIADDVADDEQVSSLALTLETAQNTVKPCGLWKGTDLADAELRHASRPSMPDLAQYPIPGSLTACSSLVRLSTAGEATASAEFVNVSVVYTLPALGDNGIGTSPSFPENGGLKTEQNLVPSGDDLVVVPPGENEEDLRLRCVAWDRYGCGTTVDGRLMVCFVCRCMQHDEGVLCDS